MSFSNMLIMFQEEVEIQTPINSKTPAPFSMHTWAKSSTVQLNRVAKYLKFHHSPAGWQWGHWTCTHWRLCWSV